MINKVREKVLAPLRLELVGGDKNGAAAATDVLARFCPRRRSPLSLGAEQWYTCVSHLMNFVLCTATGD